MTDRLIRFWRWVGTHRMLVGWVAAVLCIAMFGGGVALGVTRDLPARFVEPVDAKPAAVGSASVQAVVTRHRGNALIAVTAAGERLLIRTNERTIFRRRGETIPSEDIRRGARILVLGRPAGEGVIVARAVVVRGRALAAPAEPEPTQ
jgi:hypothetical protein